MDFTRCYGCMQELSAPGAVCPHCGYDNTNDPKNPEKQPSHVLPCGTVLNGKYITGRSLGQGGFGITYIGFDLSLEQPVCIKEYFPEGVAMRSATQSGIVLWSADAFAQSLKDGQESFVKEAQKAVMLHRLNHVVAVWDVFFENETAYIIMEYIAGETFKSRLVRTQKTFSEKECVRLLTPVMEDLEKAHERGIIHRDIKPDNIMLRNDDEAILLDMGAAKDLNKAAARSTDKDGLSDTASSSTMVVSAGFSPREQYRRKGRIGPWTDVYAMCATLYYCVSGKVPPTPMDRDDGEPLDLGLFSPALARVLKKGLSLSTEDRIQSMRELRDALNGAVSVPSDKKANKNLPLMLGAVALVLLLAFFALQLPARREPSIPAASTPSPLETELVHTSAPIQMPIETPTQAPITPPQLGLQTASPTVPPLTLSTFSGNLSDYVPVAFQEASASSCLVENGYVYEAAFSMDRDEELPWIEGVKGNGVGEYLSLSFGHTESIDLLCIRPGFPSVFEKNNRPRMLEFTFSDGTSAWYEMDDRNGYLYIQFSHAVETDAIKITIQSVYPGKVPDTCISEISAYSRKR